MSNQLMPFTQGYQCYTATCVKPSIYAQRFSFWRSEGRKLEGNWMRLAWKWPLNRGGGGRHWPFMKTIAGCGLTKFHSLHIWESYPKPTKLTLNLINHTNPNHSSTTMKLSSFQWTNSQRCL